MSIGSALTALTAATGTASPVGLGGTALSGLASPDTSSALTGAVRLGDSYVDLSRGVSAEGLIKAIPTPAWIALAVIAGAVAVPLVAKAFKG